MNTGAAAPRTADSIFWSGAYARPSIGQDKAPALGGKHGIENRKPGSTKATVEPQRIVVAKSGDLAYEYSTTTLEFDLKSGEHVVHKGAQLRVWQKENGQWKQAAVFVRPFPE